MNKRWVWLELHYEIGVANSRHIMKDIRTMLTWKTRKYERGRTILFVCLSGQMISDSQEPGRRMDPVWRERGWPTMDTLAPFQREGEGSISSSIPPYCCFPCEEQWDIWSLRLGTVGKSGAQPIWGSSASESAQRDEVVKEGWHKLADGLCGYLF